MIIIGCVGGKRGELNEEYLFLENGFLRNAKKDTCCRNLKSLLNKLKYFREFSTKDLGLCHHILKYYLTSKKHINDEINCLMRSFDVNNANACLPALFVIDDRVYQYYPKKFA